MQCSIWSIFLARQLRDKVDIKLDCVDISSDLFPTKPWQTPDVTYHVHDCFKPFSPEFYGQFDVVHVRFWLLFTSDEDVPGLLAEFHKLLSERGLPLIRQGPDECRTGRLPPVARAMFCGCSGDQDGRFSLGALE